MLLFGQRSQRKNVVPLLAIVAIMCNTYLMYLIIRKHILKNHHNSDKTLKLFVHTNERISNYEEAIIVSKQYPNIPIEYWLENKRRENEMFFHNNTCAKFPDIKTLSITDLYWQSVSLSDQTSLLLYSAFYDIRQSAQHGVRILGMVNRTAASFPANRTLFCQIWYSGDRQPLISEVKDVTYIWHLYWQRHHDGMYGPYLVNCPIPDSHKYRTPKVVSLVEAPCDHAANMLKIVYNKPAEERKKEFGVCVKGLDFLQVDMSVKLIEWIELILLLGADKIYFYRFNVHPNILKILDYYAKLGKVDVTETTIPKITNVPLIQQTFISEHSSVKALTELIPYNDCFYRNIYKYDYMAILDVDEVIVPYQDDDWHGLMSRVSSKINPNKKYASFNARNAYFLDSMTPEGTFPDIPSYMHMLQHVYRSINFTKPGYYVKSFFNTNETIACHNHLPISHSKESSFSYNIDPEDGFMHHYRKSCVAEIKCDDYLKDPVKDVRLWTHKDILVERVNKVLLDLDFFHQ